MDIDIEQISSKLNCISRMAIIENAPNTEKMLIAFAKILKYRYQTENQVVIAETEMKLAEVLIEYYNTQTNCLIEFIYLDEAKSLSMVFIPHFSLLSIYYCVLNVFGNIGNQDHMTIHTEVTVSDEVTLINIIFKSNSDMQAIYKEAYDFVQDEYTSIKQAIARMETAFCASDVSIHCSNSMMEVQIRI